MYVYIQYTYIYICNIFIYLSIYCICRCIHIDILCIYTYYTYIYIHITNLNSSYNHIYIYNILIYNLIKPVTSCINPVTSCHLNCPKELRDRKPVCAIIGAFRGLSLRNRRRQLPAMSPRPSHFFGALVGLSACKNGLGACPQCAHFKFQTHIERERDASVDSTKNISCIKL